MATSTSSTGKATKSTPADARALTAAKIQEGIYKVKMIGRHVDKADNDCEALRKQVEDMAAVMQSELRLDEYCSDLGDMHKARLDYHGASLSEAERRSLRQIHDLAASAIADYEAVLGPAPAFKNTITMLSDAIPMECPAPLAPYLRPAAVNGGNDTW
uniref:Uncharacterized protein n=1 Tax=Avena sativa TaxID=4498 RepID=A0ACD5UU49_AVESA